MKAGLRCRGGGAFHINSKKVVYGFYKVALCPKVLVHFFYCGALKATFGSVYKLSLKGSESDVNWVYCFGRMWSKFRPESHTKSQCHSSGQDFLERKKYKRSKVTSGVEIFSFV